jgi:hypothetical protein
LRRATWAGIGDEELSAGKATAGVQAYSFASAPIAKALLEAH